LAARVLQSPRGIFLFGPADSARRAYASTPCGQPCGNEGWSGTGEL